MEKPKKSKDEFETTGRARKCLRCGVAIAGRGHWCAECVEAMADTRRLLRNPNTRPVTSYELDAICAREGRLRGQFVAEPVGRMDLNASQEEEAK